VSRIDCQSSTIVFVARETEITAQVLPNLPTMQADMCLCALGARVGVASEKVMRRCGIRLTMAMVLIGGFGSGCQLPRPRKPYPPDPMFESKQPLERPTQNPTTASPIAAAVAAPRPPQFPRSVIFQTPPTRDESSPNRPVDHPDPTPFSGSTSVAKVDSASEESTMPPLVRAHAEDFRWIVGVMEKQLDGRLLLRFDDADGSFGGKVQLQPEPLLAGIADGDLIRVEGLLVPELTAPPADWWDKPPRYRVIAVNR
jgi:hypothetical protein